MSKHKWIFIEQTMIGGPTSTEHQAIWVVSCLVIIGEVLSPVTGDCGLKFEAKLTLKHHCC